MGKVAYYGDTIFLLGEMIRVLHDALELDVDSASFTEHLAHDLEFIDATLDKVFHGLSDSARLIDRPEHLKNLMRTERQLADALEKLRSGRSTLAAELRERFPNLEARAERLEATIKQIQSILARSDVGESGDMISQAEYEFLLTDSDQES